MPKELKVYERLHSRLRRQKDAMNDSVLSTDKWRTSFRSIQCSIFQFSSSCQIRHRSGVCRRVLSRFREIICLFPIFTCDCLVYTFRIDNADEGMASPISAICPISGAVIQPQPQPRRLPPSAHLPCIRIFAEPLYGERSRP